MDLKQKKPSLKWVWIVVTVIFSILFSFALIPGVEAQGIIDAPQAQRQDYVNLMQRVYNFILQNYVEDVDPKVIYEGALNGMFGALNDPYSVYLTESEMNDMGDTTQGSFGGVGLNITQSVGPRPDGKPRYVEVASPIEDTPGWRAGINPGDFIKEINGILTDTLNMDEVLGMLRGTPGESVRLVIKRGDKMEFPVTIVRAIIEVPTVKHAMIDDIGYLKLLTFTPMTSPRARDAIIEFKSKNYKAIILDLRNNYGGLLNSAVEISNLFLDGGLVVRIRSRIARENRDFNANRETLVSADIPIIVLINQGSASASEIVAGALKDRGRAYLVGENTYGKGSVQSIYPLNAAGFKITTARYFTPSDVYIDKVGIPPDREIILFPELTEEDFVHLNELINDNKIPGFAENNPQATAAQIEAFAVTLRNDYHLDLSFLKRMIKNELNRTVLAPVYDLEYDVQLLEAVNIIKNGQYSDLMKNFKTLKKLQEEAEEENNFALAG